jgi:hypothetical protein
LLELNMHFSRLTLAGLAGSQAAAVTLWATAYNGGVFSLNLAQNKGGYTLTEAAIPGGSTACGIDASWLTKDKYNDVVYCVDEAWGLANGTITSFKPTANGSLALFDTESTLASPVATVVYNGGAALVAAH